MPVTEKKYPDWVQEQRVRGTTVKKKGDTYYLYKRTSRRVPGKKYPQPVDTYIGIITPEGVIKSEKKKYPLVGYEVREYGFFKAVWQFCPEGWKKSLGNDWEDVPSIILWKWYSWQGRKTARAFIRQDFDGINSGVIIKDNFGCFVKQPLLGH